MKRILVGAGAAAAVMAIAGAPLIVLTGGGTPLGFLAVVIVPAAAGIVGAHFARRPLGAVAAVISVSWVAIAAASLAGFGGTLDLLAVIGTIVAMGYFTALAVQRPAVAT